ncbi:hypothetical protein CVT25_002584 [Psilocybe cyanescens]|uniref:Uncharacterized protein n=1 Tax=Psilocybe cyanescens TaxID=93625 RepID=A0A409WLB3_PSICY|nr:hypothetical protein CVT25_002584 [Psilocybe cyanescens]
MKLLSIIIIGVFASMSQVLAMPSGSNTLTQCGGPDSFPQDSDHHYVLQTLRAVEEIVNYPALRHPHMKEDAALNVKNANDVPETVPEIQVQESGPPRWRYKLTI